MDEQDPKARMPRLRAAVKQQWDKITDDQLPQAETDLERFSREVVRVYGIAHEKVQHEIDKIVADLNSLNHPADTEPGPPSHAA